MTRLLPLLRLLLLAALLLPPPTPAEGQALLLCSGDTVTLGPDGAPVAPERHACSDCLVPFAPPPPALAAPAPPRAPQALPALADRRDHAEAPPLPRARAPPVPV